MKTSLWRFKADTLVGLGVFLVIALSACSWKSSSQRSILVIFVENLGFGSFSCSESADSGRGLGLQSFCDEGVRFTHAYTTSTLSQSAIASVFTARYPYEHGLRHNGAQALPADTQTIAELALARGFRTAFFSGGPPIWRRSGLNQGFEIFDDLVNLGIQRLYRPAPEVIRAFLNWREVETKQDKTLAFLYLPDLQFIDAATVNEIGELRESSFASQLEAVDEALGHLVKAMKKNKTWDSTDIILLGLQAEANDTDRVEEIPALNLFSESTRVTLMMKPARQARDGNFNWKIDANVSSIDVGATLRDLVGSVRPLPRLVGGMAESLKAALSGPQPDWPSDRQIITESAWAEWRGWGGIRVAVRQGPYLFLFDERDQLFNTFTDNLESSPLPSGETPAKVLRRKFGQFLRERGFREWKPSLTPQRWSSLTERLALGRELWRNRIPPAEILARLQNLSKRRPDDPVLTGWRAIWDLRLGNWSDLKACAGPPRKRPFWSYVAARNLSEKSFLPDGPCFEPLRTGLIVDTARFAKDCGIDGLADLFSAARDAGQESSRTRAIELFEHFESMSLMAKRVSEQNQSIGQRWDTVPFQDEPDLVDLALALPEMKKLRLSVSKEVRTK